jgi:integrase
MNTRQDQSPSFGSFITGQYIPNVKCFKRSWRTDESLLRIHVFPLLATRLIGQIDLTGIISVVCRMQEAGYSSGSINRVLAVLRRAFNLALKWQVCGVSGNPVSGLSVGPDILRSRFLSLEEAHRLIAALEADENRVAANAILLLLLTGARRNEITHAKWDDVNWGSKTLFVPVSKTGRPRMIALSRSAISLLQALQRSPGNAYIFPSPISTPTPRVSTSARWRFGRRSSVETTPTWLRPSATWGSSTGTRASTRRRKRTTSARLVIYEEKLGTDHPDVARTPHRPGLGG